MLGPQSQSLRSNPHNLCQSSSVPAKESNFARPGSNRNRLKSVLLKVDRTDDNRRHVFRVNICSRNAAHVFDRDRANQIGILFEIVEAEPVDFGFQQKVRDLRILLKTQNEAASEI